MIGNSIIFLLKNILIKNTNCSKTVPCQTEQLALLPVHCKFMYMYLHSDSFYHELDKCIIYSFNGTLFEFKLFGDEINFTLNNSSHLIVKDVIYLLILFIYLLANKQKIIM